MIVVDVAYDLRYEPTEVGADMVVECWITQGPRSADATFDPAVGDVVLVGDDELPPRQARVVRRTGNRVWLQLPLPGIDAAVA
ncbi:MAG: hypothetical protein M3431_11990 [Actinomycetota bacterium]|nr:hypothetical protein [Actinomycetota bacterium]